MNKISYKAPLYEQIEHLLYEKIRTQEYLPGQKIPSERELAEHYKISRTTTKRAVNLLVEQGLLVRKLGKGTFVVSGLDQRFNISFESSGSMTDSLSSSGISISNKQIRFFTNIDSRFLRQKLALNENEPVYGVQRLKLHSGIPFALENSYVPGKYFPNFYQINFNNIGLYDYMNSMGHNLKDYQTYQQLETLMTEEAKLLQISTNTFVFKSCYSSIDQDQNIIEYTESYVKAKEGKIHYHLRLSE